MYLLLDIGGTNIRVGVSSDLANIAQFKIIPTNFDFKRAMVEIKQLADELRNGGEIKAVASGVKALNKDKTGLLVGPYVHLWEKEPLKSTLEEIFNCPVFLEGDGAMTGLGEAVFGPGKNLRIVAYLTISTGFGGARIVDGKIDVSAMGFEPGHQIIDVDGSLLKTNAPMAMEAYVSGFAFNARFGKEAAEVTDSNVWEETAKMVAVGINNTLVYWSPDIVIIGGSMIKSMSLDKIKQYTKNVVKIFPDIPEIVTAELGDTGGLHGDMALLKSKDI